MRLFLVEFGVKVASIVNPVSSYELNRMSDIEHSAITLDQYIFGSRQTVDWVLFTQHEDIKFEEFSLMEKYMPADSKTIFSAKGNTLECFYCRPAIYSILGSMNKTEENKFLMLARQRIDIQWI